MKFPRKHVSEGNTCWKDTNWFVGAVDILKAVRDVTILHRNNMNNNILNFKMKLRKISNEICRNGPSLIHYKMTHSSFKVPTRIPMQIRKCAIYTTRKVYINLILYSFYTRTHTLALHILY